MSDGKRLPRVKVPDHMPEVVRRAMLATMPVLEYRFSDTRIGGEHVDYFRDHYGRCVAVIGARLKMPDGVIAEPTPTFDRIEVDGARYTADAILNEMTPKVMRTLYAVKWEQIDERQTGIIRP